MPAAASRVPRKSIKGPRSASRRLTLAHAGFGGLERCTKCGEEMLRAELSEGPLGALHRWTACVLRWQRANVEHLISAPATRRPRRVGRAFSLDSGGCFLAGARRTQGHGLPGARSAPAGWINAAHAIWGSGPCAPDSGGSALASSPGSPSASGGGSRPSAGARPTAVAVRDSGAALARPPLRRGPADAT
jgi:hypothetical protein